MNIVAFFFMSLLAFRFFAIRAKSFERQLYGISRESIG